MKNEYWAAILIIGLSIIIASVWLIQNNQPHPPQEFHAHADFAVFINGNRLDFAKEKFMTTNQQSLSERVHLHDLDGNVIHVHASKVTLGEFFESLGMQFSNNCLVLETGQSQCTSSKYSLQLFINGKPNNEFENYEPKDLDHILISYGNETIKQIQQQIESVSDNACIFSEKCPERGPAPPESCTPGRCIA